MPAQHRRVEIAPGHSLLVRRLSDPATRPGHIVVCNRHRQPFELPVERWESGEVG